MVSLSTLSPIKCDRFFLDDDMGLHWTLEGQLSIITVENNHKVIYEYLYAHAHIYKHVSNKDTCSTDDSGYQDGSRFQGYR